MLSSRYLLAFISKRSLHRRTSNVIKEKLQPNDFLWKTIENSNIKSTKDWKTLRNEILNVSGPKGPITPGNIDAMTVGICTSKKEYDLASSYLDFLEKEQIKPNLATLGKYFRLLYVKNVHCELSREEQDRILKMYEDVRQSYPVLDALTLENIIQAVSLTNKWKMCVDLLNEIKVTAPPSANAYNAMVAAAFLNNEDDLAWQLFVEMLDKNKNVYSEVYSSYFKKIAKNPKTDIFRKIETMFHFLQQNSLKIDSNNVEDLIDLLKIIKIDVRSSTVTQRGICKCCKNKLKAFDLTENEFNNLKHQIFQNVIIGKDVFNKTTPDELEKFQNFISKMENFDVVVDGLNVAYSAGVRQSPLVTSGLVAAVVSHFVNQGKKVLVLGRNHMNRWPKENWGFILKNTTVFLTQDLSQDDPFLLYCALNSGKDTIIVSKDLMRGHKFLLRNGHLKVLFDRWLLQRQYQLVHVPASGNPVFKKPLPFSNVAQKNEKFWHVPYVLSNQDKNSTKNDWLCIRCQ